jgi:hypothetical protein
MSLQKATYGFVPTSITGCALWLDGADPAGNGVVPSAGVSSSWVDKSVNAWTATQATGGRQPSLVLNSLNGLPGFSFTNANNQSFATAAQTSLNSISGLSIFAVLLPTWSSGAAVANPSFFGMRIYNGGATKINYYVHNNYSETDIFNGSGVFYHTSSVTTSAIGQNKVFIYSGTNNNGTDITYPNGSLTGDSTSASFGSGTSLPIIVGGDNTDGECWQGYIYEVIFYTRVLSTTERQQVEGYLAQKWGLKSSLPVTHPGLGTTLYRSDYTKQNVMTARPFYTAFSPRSIAGCTLWLDATDSSTITTVTGVSQWNDKSGNGYNLTQGSTGSQPTRTENLLNFLSNNYLNIPQAAVNNLSTWSIFFVINPISSTNWIMVKQKNGVNTFNVLSMTSNTNSGGGPQSGSTGFLYWRSFNAGSQLASTGAITTSTLQIGNLTYDGTNLYFYKNGVLEKTTAGSFAIPNDTSSTNYTMGIWIQDGTIINSGVTNFRLGEMLVYNTGLTTTQRQQVESYLAQKWGLTASLPGGHLNATQPAGAVTLTALTNFRTLSQPRRYTSFRWTITAGNTESLIQFSEFQVGFNSTQLVFASPTTATTGSSISWNTGAGEGPAQAVDNNINTKGLGIGTSGLVLIVTVATPIAANMYRWATANDVTPGRNPTQWTVDGSADGTTFVRLHTQNTAYSTPSSTFTFTSWIPFTYS